MSTRTSPKRGDFCSLAAKPFLQLFDEVLNKRLGLLKQRCILMDEINQFDLILLWHTFLTANRTGPSSPCRDTPDGYCQKDDIPGETPPACCSLTMKNWHGDTKRLELNGRHAYCYYVFIQFHYPAARYLPRPSLSRRP